MELAEGGDLKKQIKEKIEYNQIFEEDMVIF
jgi:hypothetical protein